MSVVAMKFQLNHLPNESAKWVATTVAGKYQRCKKDTFSLRFSKARCAPAIPKTKDAAGGTGGVRRS
jgi:hypothetical protein